MWCMRHVSLEGNITTFKSLVISKIVHLTLFTIFPENIIEKLNEIQKKFLCANKNVKLNIVHCVMITKKV